MSHYRPFFVRWWMSRVRRIVKHEPDCGAARRIMALFTLSAAAPFPLLLMPTSSSPPCTHFCALIWSPLESSPPAGIPTIRSVAVPTRHEDERERRWRFRTLAPCGVTWGCWSLRRRTSILYVFRLRDFSARMIFGANVHAPRKSLLRWSRIFLFCYRNFSDVSSSDKSPRSHIFEIKNCTILVLYQNFY